MNRYLKLFAFCCLLMPVKSWGQQIPVIDLFPLDDSVASNVEAVELYGTAELKDLPLKKTNLKMFLPPVGDMGNAPPGSSLGWAIGYYVTSMTFRLKDSEALSPDFLFDMMTKADAKCQLPNANYMKEIQQILKEVGCLRKRDYVANQNCMQHPDLGKYKNAPRYRVDLNSVLLAKQGEGLSYRSVMYAIRRKLDSGVPIIGIMKADHAFRKLSNEGLWHPDNGADLYTHAVAIVGYDDFNQEVEVVNCWGKSWGKNGFGRIRYKDLYAFKQLYQVSKPTAYALAKISKKTSEKPVSDIDVPVKLHGQTLRPSKPVILQTTVPELATTNLYGTLSLRIPEGLDQNQNILFQDLNYSKTNGVYENIKTTHWPADQQFQLVATQLTPSSFIYLFSIDPNGKASLHWPQKASLGNLVLTPYSALVSDSATSFVLPRPRVKNDNNTFLLQERAFSKDTEGTDFLVVLHSREELDDEELLHVVETMKGQFTSAEFIRRLNNTLGNRLADNSVQDKISGKIKYTVKTGKGYILPIVLRID